MEANKLRRDRIISYSVLALGTAAMVIEGALRLADVPFLPFRYALSVTGIGAIIAIIGWAVMRHGSGTRMWWFLGTAIGLSIIVKIVELHSVQMFVRDSFGLGPTDFERGIEAPLYTIVIALLLATFLSVLFEATKARHSLSASEARFRHLYEANIVGVIFVRDARVVNANDAFLEIVGYSRDELPIKVKRFLPPDESNRIDDSSIRSVSDTGAAPLFEMDAVHKQGHRIPILVGTSSPTSTSSNIVAFIIDLSREKQSAEEIHRLEAELAKTSRLSMMNELTAGLAHEVHQPLGAVTNYANGLLIRLRNDKASRKDMIDRLEDIASETVRAGSILRRLRDMIRDREPERRAVRLDIVLRESLELVKYTTREYEVNVRLDLAEELPEVRADATQITQVVLNLVLNAVDAMSDSGENDRTITIRAAPIEQGYIEVTVADTGPGVPAELRDRIYDQFYTTKKDGLGMGLAISRSIVESHGGNLALASSTPEGATFRFTLVKENAAGLPAKTSPSRSRSSKTA